MKAKVSPWHGEGSSLFYLIVDEKENPVTVYADPDQAQAFCYGFNMAVDFINGVERTEGR